jgi:predicted dehydrogenase
VTARHIAHGAMHGWSIDAEFSSGTLGHLELISPAHGDFEEGFRIHGTRGSVNGKALLPWFQTAHVGTFRDGQYRRLLGEDGYAFTRQMEGFAGTILDGAPQHGESLEDGSSASVSGHA